MAYREFVKRQGDIPAPLLRLVPASEPCLDAGSHPSLTEIPERPIAAEHELISRMLLDYEAQNFQASRRAELCEARLFVVRSQVFVVGVLAWREANATVVYAAVHMELDNGNA
jgi:hypothetical protein